jgi:nickel-dependent lactate racemase
MKVKLKKGHNLITVSISDAMIIDVLKGRDIPGLKHEYIQDKISRGIEKSIPKDIKKKKNVIIVPDNTRLWARGDIFVPVIVKTLLETGVPEKSIKIIIALGTHSDLKHDQFSSLVGNFCIGKVEILNSANKNRKRLAYLGRTPKETELFITKEACEADHIIIFGGVLHHLIAGFGGGRKYILPGIAGYDSIQQNHSLAFLKDGNPHPMVKPGQTLDNPVNEDMEDGAALFFKGKTLSYVAVAANGMGDIFHVGIGPVNETFRQGCKKLNHACTEKITQKGDFALISAGGHRKDGQLYQATKALFNAINAVKENGKILFVAEAVEGIGNTDFEKVLIKYQNNPEKIGKALVEKFDMPSYVGFRVLDVLKRFDVTLVSSFSKLKTEELGFTYIDNIERYIKSLKGKGYIIPFAENILPVSDNLI